MGAFDNDLGIPFANEFQEGEPFLCEGMAVGPYIQTSFGDARIVFLTIGGQRYSIFGNGLLNQARNASPDDFPARVMLVRKATRNGQEFKTLVPVEDDKKDAKGPRKNSAKRQAEDDIPF